MRRFQSTGLPGLTAALVLIIAAAGGCGGKNKEEPVAEQTPPAEQQARPTRQTVSEATDPTPPPLTPPRPEPAQPTIVRDQSTSPHGFYTIQLSSWRTRAKAESEAARYREQGLEAYVQEAVIPEMGTWYRVRIGNYPVLSEAQEAARSLVSGEGYWVDNDRREIPPA